MNKTRRRKTVIKITNYGEPNCKLAIDIKNKNYLNLS